MIIKNCYLSVIVPIYNAEQYLRQCIDSIVSNNCCELEIVLVDDGSTDNCGAICDEYADSNGSIIVIHKKNEGLVSARKTGAKVSHGQYLTFVDADDFVDNNLYSLVIAILKKDNNNEVLISSYKSNGEIFTNNVSDGLYDRNAIESIILKSALTDESFKSKITPAVWVKFFPTQLFMQNMNMVDDAIRDGEDVLFSLSCLMKAESVRINNEVTGYNYRIIDSSMSHEFNRDYNNATKMCVCLETIIRESGYDKVLAESIVYTEAYMYYRYVDRELFDNSEMNNTEKCNNLKRVLLSSKMGNSFMKINIIDMKIPFMLKLELYLLQQAKMKNVQILRKAERLVRI